MRGDASSFDRLVFSVHPPRKARVNQPLPLFEVQGNPGIDAEVDLVVIGGATVQGTARKRLRPNGPHPAIAFFDDIILTPRMLRFALPLPTSMHALFVCSHPASTPAGRYLLQVQSVKNPAVHVRAIKPTSIGVFQGRSSSCRACS